MLFMRSVQCPKEDAAAASVNMHAGVFKHQFVRISMSSVLHRLASRTMLRLSMHRNSSTLSFLPHVPRDGFQKPLPSAYCPSLGHELTEHSSLDRLVSTWDRGGESFATHGEHATYEQKRTKRK